jgi:Flp pilus assembly pilin Flp
MNSVPSFRSLLAMFHRAGDVARRLHRDERGATLVEYIVLVGVVALIGLAAFKTFGTAVAGRVTNQATTVGNINSN